MHVTFDITIVHFQFCYFISLFCYLCASDHLYESLRKPSLMVIICSNILEFKLVMLSMILSAIAMEPTIYHGKPNTAHITTI